MNYISTRNKSIKSTAAEAIAKGISDEGGLFVPDNFPELSKSDFDNLISLDYVGRAEYILEFFLNDFTQDEIKKCVEGAYRGTFDDDMPAPLAVLSENVNILELWHGPTCAFKDLALQLLPFLLTTSAKKTSEDKKTVILVATSGDTGKAALEGFRDVENTDIIVFYPSEGVSPMQKLQMDSQAGKNVMVCAIEGNFDDAQSGVKAIFADSKIKELLNENNMEFSSANSINWGRLVPQIIYYISAFCDLKARGEDYLKDGFNVVVPTGNFGNILAAYYAKKMGVPINKLICASNSNNVLTDFIKTGKYDRNRKFHTTISPSMDILISSNLERMIFELSGNDDVKVAQWQKALTENGCFSVDDKVKDKLNELFYGGFCDDTQTLQTINNIFSEYGYLCDTHTGVAVNVFEQYKTEIGDTRPVVIASTASPYKFSSSVICALSKREAQGEFETAEMLSEITNVSIPEPISKLKNSKVRFNNLCKKEDMSKVVLDYLGL